MEKLLYPLWKPASQSGDEFREELLRQLAPQLADVQGVHGLRVAVVDSAVAPADARRMENRTPVPHAMLSLWVDSAEAAERWEPFIDGHCSRKTVYLVAEAEPLVGQDAHPSVLGERVYGMCQVVFLSPPAQLEQEDWLPIWKDSHTQIAIDTQSTFGYRQNLVVRRLGSDTPECHAVVEEHFPPEAMASDHAFYATGGDEAVLKKHMTEMVDSCVRFIDFEKIDVIPMSEYVIKPLVRD